MSENKNNGPGQAPPIVIGGGDVALNAFLGILGTVVVFTFILWWSTA